jgi:acetyl-CoA carboxylase, biotin carboxylase subunit
MTPTPMARSEQKEHLFRKVLVANRGAIAARVIRCLRALGIASVAVYSEADAGAPYLAEADESLAIGPASAHASYLDQDRILEAAKACGVDAIHPGYGFLSENPTFAARVRDAGLCFIAPSPRLIEAMGEKTRARALMAEHGMPIAAGSGILDADSTIVADAARRIGYPVLIKPAAGGGGIGMIEAADEAALLPAIERSGALAKRTFANPKVYLEKLIQRPRHIEFQILADRYGNVAHLFERDCSIQRRHQKIIEEAPAPGVPRAVIEAVGTQITQILSELGYDNIGTVEMLMDADDSFYFLEVNTRIQVEHAVTEMVTGVDLVEAQIRLAAGAPLIDVFPRTPKLTGHAIEARVYAEDPKSFFPSSGCLRTFRPPPNSERLRIETGYAEGRVVTQYYDPLLAKVIAAGPTRPQAIANLREALTAFQVEGIKTNLPLLLQVLNEESFATGAIDTGFINRLQKQKG